MVRRSARGARLAVKEARLITAELRRLGVPSHTGEPAFQRIFESRSHSLKKNSNKRWG